MDPVDFENFVLKNRTLLQNDPQRELLLYPPDDVSVSLMTFQKILLINTKYLPCPVITASGIAQKMQNDGADCSKYFGPNRRH